ncbi:MAG: VOC family protein [Acidimicrobiales bacterium]|nr:VOC family protein [Acidimicrobiales bacterium]
MTIRWLQAVIDIPADRFTLAGDFWRKVSASGFGQVHPEHDEFTHLVRPDGDMHLELQRTNDDHLGVHLDLLVDDIDTTASRATELGARILSNPGHAVLESPGGVVFCLVSFSGESKRATAIELPSAHAVDQICLDVPAEHFQDVVGFWSAFSGWEPNPQVRDEFCSFAQPSLLPLRLLVQRLGPSDPSEGRAHVDISCGEGVEAVAARHADLGATIVESRRYWTVMNDPAGMPYCLTRRQPH